MEHKSLFSHLLSSFLCTLCVLVLTTTSINDNKPHLELSNFWLNMAYLMSVFVITTLLAYGYCSRIIVESEDRNCPDYCFCYNNHIFFNKVHFVADCTESNITSEEYKNKPFPANNNINKLQLYRNSLTNIQNTTFSGLPALMDIDLSFNSINYVHPKAFVENVNLVTLRLENNMLNEVNGPFLYSTSLRILHLENCNISKLSPDFFVNIRLLGKLYLSGNPLYVIERGVFDPFYRLRHLSINNCKLRFIPKTAFLGLKYLISLELTDNTLNIFVDWLKVLSNLGELQHLDLRGASATNLPNNAFINNKKLTSLILSQNELSDSNFAVIFGHVLDSLNYLDLSNSHLNGQLLTVKTFANVKYIRTLILSRNNFGSDELGAAITPLVHLVKLSVKSCRLKLLPIKVLPQLTSLQELDISQNPLVENFMEFLISPLKSLMHLDMGYIKLNKISKHTFPKQKLPALNTLILSGNEIKNVEPGSNQILTQLKVLEMNNCGIRRLNDTEILNGNSAYPFLEELSLSNNPLELNDAEPILSTKLSNLKSLDLSKCNLRSIPVNAFKTTPNIEWLSLNENKLKRINGSSFMFLKHLTNLKQLNLTFNELSSIKLYDISNNYQLVSLNLFGNPWVCDCYIVDLWDWATSSNRSISILMGTGESYFFQEDSWVSRDLLVCTVDPETSPVLTVSKVKLQRAWAWYMHESSCTSHL